MEEFAAFRRILIYDTDLLEETREHNNFLKNNKIVTLEDLFKKVKSKDIVYSLDVKVNKEIMAFIRVCSLKYLGYPIDMGIDVWGRHHTSYWMRESNLKKMTYLGFNLKRVVEIGLEVLSCDYVCSLENDSLSERGFVSIAEILMNEDVLKTVGSLKISDEELNRIMVVSCYLKNTLDNLDILGCRDISLLQAKERDILRQEKTLKVARKMIRERKRNLCDKASN